MKADGAKKNGGKSAMVLVDSVFFGIVRKAGRYRHGGALVEKTIVSIPKQYKITGNHVENVSEFFTKSVDPESGNEQSSHSQSLDGSQINGSSHKKHLTNGT